MFKKYIKLLIVLLLLSGCTFKQNTSSTDYSEILQHKKTFLLPEEPLNVDISTPTNEEIDALESFLDVPNAELSNSKKEIREDMEDLKWMLSTFYGRYLLYEDEFNQAFDTIIDEVPTKGADRAALTSIIMKNFSFNKDYHLLIDGFQSSIRFDNTYDLDNEFTLEDDKAINITTNEELDKIDYLKPFLTPDLEIVYREVNRPTSRVRNVQFRSDFKQLDLDVPYIHVDDFSEHNFEFDDFANEINNSEISVIDLRNNAGGQQYYPGYWYTLLTGQKVQYSFDGFMRTDPSTTSILDNSMITVQFGAIKRDNYYEFVPSDTIHHQNGLIIVLQNSYTYSAAELLVDYLHHLDNTIFIGTPTNGTLSSNIFGGPYYLKNSGIGISFGNLVTNFNPVYFSEEKGFEPDLFVMDNQMQVVIEALIMKLSSK